MPIIFNPITTDLLLLRSIVGNDIDHVFKGLSNTEVIKYYGINYKTLEETKMQMDWFNNLAMQGTGIWLALCAPDNRIFYGAVGLNNLSTIHQKAELGFWLLPEFWGKGLMAKAVPLICRYAFENLGLNRIEAFVETANQSSKNLLTKLHFEHEGTMKDCEMKNNNFISLDIYALFKHATN